MTTIIVSGRRFVRPVLTALLAAALLLAVSAPVVPSGPGLGNDPEFGILIEKKGEAARELLAEPTLYRTALIQKMPCTVEDFDFLLDRPRTSIALAGRMHKSLDKYEIVAKGPGVYHISDSDEFVGDMELVAETPGRRLYYVSGYMKLVGAKLNGRMALIVEYAEREYKTGRALKAKARGYMKVDSSLAGAAFKAFAFLFPAKVDSRIKRFSTAVRKVVEGVHEDPAEVYGRLESAKNVPPDEREEFRRRFIGGKI